MDQFVDQTALLEIKQELFQVRVGLVAKIRDSLIHHHNVVDVLANGQNRGL